MRTLIVTIALTVTRILHLEAAGGRLGDCQRVAGNAQRD
jgi:hypothetical protein